MFRSNRSVYTQKVKVHECGVGNPFTCRNSCRTCERVFPVYKANETPGIKNTITSAVPSAKFLKLTEPDVVISRPLLLQLSPIVPQMHKHILLKVLVSEGLQPEGRENNLRVSL